jgi:cation diffusion facilitator CzcD-associated flavoprotein CzcO
MKRTLLARRREEPSIAVIGAGFAGIGVAVRLRKAGYERVTLLERAAGPGGTWWHNRYAGAEVDTPSVLYSYSWMPWKWTRTHVRQAELQAYLAAVIERFGLGDRIRYGTDVDRVEWHDDRQEYSLHSADGEIMRAKHVVSAVGLLSDLSMPQIPGMADFQGPLFHSAKWDSGLDVSGKRIGVVGSGSTGIQLVPALAADAKQVVQFQREPGWIVPKMARPYSDAERAALDSRLAQRAIRVRQIIQRDRGQIGGGVFRPGTKQNTGAEAGARGFINSALESRPDLIEAVTPKYVYGGKRPIISDDYYPSLLLDNVKLVTQAVKQFTETGVIDAAGDEHELDAVIMATGFKANFLTTFDVTGRGGKTIHEYWAGDERAFLGIMVPEFPNFFIMYGPNTNGGTIVTNLELQASFITAAIDRVERERGSSVEVRPWAADLYDATIQRMMVGTSFEYENNYYRSGSGRIATQWPDGVLLYGAMTKALRGPCLKVTSQLGACPPAAPVEEETS